MNRRLRSLGLPLAGLAAVFVVVLLWPRGAESQHVNCASPRDANNRCLDPGPNTTTNCYYCHNVHGGSGQALKQEAVTEALCLSCHAPAGTATLTADVHTNDTAGSSQPAFRWSCRHCHTPHAANVPPNWLGTHTHPDSSVWNGNNIQLLGTNAGDNQIQDSNAFDTGSWDTTNNITVTADNTDDPFSNATVSSSTVDKIEATTGSSSTTDIRQTSSDLGSTPGRTFTFYVWLKADTVKTVEISLLDGSTVIGSSQVLVGTSWDRYFVRRLVPAGTSNFLTVAIGVDDNRDDGATAGDYVYAWGARLEEPRATAGILTFENGVKDVVFEQRGDNTQANLQRHSFSDEDADGNGTKDGICEVCHNRTKHHCNGEATNTGQCGTRHNTGKTCTEGNCHQHVTNFIP